MHGSSERLRRRRVPPLRALRAQTSAVLKAHRRLMVTRARPRVQMHVLLALTVQLYKLYFSMGAVFLMKDLHGQLQARTRRYNLSS
jgi:hypothetical protein